MKVPRNLSVSYQSEAILENLVNFFETLYLSDGGRGRGSSNEGPGEEMLPRANTESPSPCHAEPVVEGDLASVPEELLQRVSRERKVKLPCTSDGGCLEGF